MSDIRDIPLFVPGRLCLFGEHSDWAAEHGLHEGHCIVVGTDQGLRAAARVAKGEFVVHAPQVEMAGGSLPPQRLALPWRRDALLAVAKSHSDFFRYVAGTALAMHDHGVPGGVELSITAMDLPLQKGVSSSAAVCVLVARAFDAAYGLNLFPHELMELAYRGEKLTGSQCGRMDQACIFGKTPVLLTFARGGNGDHVRIEPVFPSSGICMFFVDLGGRKDTVRILHDLGSAYGTSAQLQQALGDGNEQIVRQAYHALEAGDAAAVGGLMLRAQEQFDRLVAPHCPQELQSPLLHRLLAWPELRPHIHGGKGVGSQGDGTAQFVARSPEDRRAAMALVGREFPRMKCFELTIPAQRSG